VASPADLRAQLQSTLGTAYALERELGGGGMARVFVATETALGRAVVVKVLPPDVSTAVSAERFRREVQLAARLHHPHVVPLLSAGERDGLLYYTMPFVAGESLRARLARDGELPVSDAVRLVREVADALAYAHAQGVVHRDLKPENVLLEHGHAVVADFGVAKAIEAAAGGLDRPERAEGARDPSAASLTSRGVALGTPAYMAPEQAAADPHVDHRADLYALGCMAYELLAGTPPFPHRTPQQTLAAHVSEAPEPILRRRPNLAPALAALVMRLLEKRPADRPQSAADVLAALEALATPSGGAAPALTAAGGAPSSSAARPGSRGTGARGALVAVGVAVLLGAGALFAWRRAQPAASGAATGAEAAVPDSGKTLAVLPFENLGDSTDAYFADGVSDAVRGKLATLPGLTVIARTSSVHYRHAGKSPQQIGRELGVRYLLTGTVRWAKAREGTSRVQVSPELVEVSPRGTPAIRWQQPFDAAVTDVFDVQAEIAGRVASALDVALGGAERQALAAPPTRSLPAYEAFLKGEAAANGLNSVDLASLRRAADFYAQAVSLDSTFALAWARLTQAHADLYFQGVPGPVEAAAAAQALARAQALAPEAAETYRARAWYEGEVRGDWARASAAADSGLVRAPTDADLLTIAARAERDLGRVDRARARLELARAVDPRSVRVPRYLARVLIRLRRWPEARAAVEQGLALAPTNLELLQSKAMTYLGEGDLAGARRALRDVPPEVDQSALAAFVGNYGDYYWVLDDAQQRLLLGLRPSAFDDDRAAWGMVLAQTYWLRGDRARARSYADSARSALERQLRDNPDDWELRVAFGLALAYLGDGRAAVREGERGTALVPVSRDAGSGTYAQHVLARIYLLSGEPERALDRLEALVAMPSYLSPGVLRVDPTWDPLRGNPRFQRLVAGSR